MSPVDSAFLPPWDGKMSPAKERWCSTAGKVTAGLAKTNVSLPLGGWLKSCAGWLPVHRDQLRAQRSVTTPLLLYKLCEKSSVWLSVFDYTSLSFPESVHLSSDQSNMSHCDIFSLVHWQVSVLSPGNQPRETNERKTIRERWIQTSDSTVRIRFLQNTDIGFLQFFRLHHKQLHHSLSTTNR